MSAGRLKELVAFSKPLTIPDGAGGEETNWSEFYACAAEFIYMRGSEAIEAARLTGTATYKIRIHKSAVACVITPDFKMRDVRRGTVYNLREVDGITDLRWIYIIAESGVAV